MGFDTVNFSVQQQATRGAGTLNQVLSWVFFLCFLRSRALCWAGRCNSESNTTPWKTQKLWGFQAIPRQSGRSSPWASCSPSGPINLPATQKKQSINFLLGAFDMDTSSLPSKPKNTWKTTTEDLKLSQYIFNAKNTETEENRLKFKNQKTHTKPLLQSPSLWKPVELLAWKKRGFLPSLQFFHHSLKQEQDQEKLSHCIPVPEPDENLASRNKETTIYFWNPKPKSSDSKVLSSLNFRKNFSRLPP